MTSILDHQPPKIGANFLSKQGSVGFQAVQGAKSPVQWVARLGPGPNASERANEPAHRGMATVPRNGWATEPVIFHLRLTIQEERKPLDEDSPPIWCRWFSKQRAGAPLIRARATLPARSPGSTGSERPRELPHARAVEVGKKASPWEERWWMKLVLHEVYRDVRRWRWER